MEDNLRRFLSEFVEKSYLNVHKKKKKIDEFLPSITKYCISNIEVTHLKIYLYKDYNGYYPFTTTYNYSEYGLSRSEKLKIDALAPIFAYNFKTVSYN